MISIHFKKVGIFLSLFCPLFFIVFPLKAVTAPPDSLFTQGKALFEMGKYKQAKAKFLQYLTQHPNDPLTLFYLGKAELNGVQSQEYFRSLLNSHPDHPLAANALFRIAQYWYAKGYYLTAQQQFLRLIQQYPQSSLVAKSHYYIGRVLLALNRPTEAEKQFKEFLHRYPDSELRIHAEAGLVDAYQLQGKYRMAISLADSLVNRASPFKSHLLYTLAECYRRVGERQKADQTLARILKECPKSYEATLVAPPAKTEEASRIDSTVIEDSTAIEASAPGKSSADSSAQYYIQVGAFSNIANATSLHSRLKADGFPARLGTKFSAQNLLYLVRVGPYKTRASAEEVAEKIRKTEGIRCLVKQVPPKQR